MPRWPGEVGVPERVERYVSCVLERMRYNVEEGLPLTMGENPGAFLAWMGLPPRTLEQERRAQRALFGGEPERDASRRAYRSEWDRMNRLARKMEES